jgi:hypothetical protein
MYADGLMENFVNIFPALSALALPTHSGASLSATPKVEKTVLTVARTFFFSFSCLFIKSDGESEKIENSFPSSFAADLRRVDAGVWERGMSGKTVTWQAHYSRLALAPEKKDSKR